MDYVRPYVEFLKKYLNLAKPIKVVFDCSNGTTGLILGELFKTQKLINSKLINRRPDGRFPAHGPNPMAEGAMDDLRAAVLKNKADLGVIFDADGDRAFFVDDLGRQIRGDVAAVLIAQGIRGTIVLDLLAGYPAKELLARNRRIFESRVGSYFMKKMMKEKKAKFGAENSGHYYFPIEGTVFDTGILASIYLMNRVSKMKDRELKLSKWLDKLPRYHRSPELNFEITDKAKMLKIVEERYEENAKSISHLDGLKMEFEGWWFSLRPSNTEDLLRLNLEAKDEAVFKKELQILKSLLTLLRKDI